MSNQAKPKGGERTKHLADLGSSSQQMLKSASLLQEQLCKLVAAKMEAANDSPLPIAATGTLKGALAGLVSTNEDLAASLRASVIHLSGLNQVQLPQLLDSVVVTAIGRLKQRVSDFDAATTLLTTQVSRFVAETSGARQDTGRIATQGAELERLIERLEQKLGALQAESEVIAERLAASGAQPEHHTFGVPRRDRNNDPRQRKGDTHPGDGGISPEEQQPGSVISGRKAQSERLADTKKDVAKVAIDLEAQSRLRQRAVQDLSRRQTRMESRLQARTRWGLALLAVLLAAIVVTAVIGQFTLNRGLRGMASGLEELEQRITKPTTDTSTEQRLQETRAELSRELGEFSGSLEQYHQHNHELSKRISALETERKTGVDPRVKHQIQQLQASLDGVNEKLREVAQARKEGHKGQQTDRAAEHLQAKPVSSPLPVNGKRYGVQLIGFWDKRDLIAFSKQHGLNHTGLCMQAEHKGKPWYVMFSGVYSKLRQAKRALNDLPPELARLGPWIRPIPNWARVVSPQ